jgi:hypothetical protein
MVWNIVLLINKNIRYTCTEMFNLCVYKFLLLQRYVKDLTWGKLTITSSVHAVVNTIFWLLLVYWCQTRFPYQMLFVSLESNTAEVTCGAGTASYPSGVPEFTPVFSGVLVARSLVFCLMLCRSYSLVIVLSVLRFLASDYSRHGYC